LARLTLDRQVKLRKNGWSPEQRLDEASTALDELSAAMDRVKAQIESIDIDIQKSQLKAPFDGVIAARSIDEGAVIVAGTPILTVLEDGHRQLRVGLPPEVAAKLDEAKSYRVQTSAGPAEARLYASRPDLQSATRTVTALFDVTTGEATPFGEIVTLVLERDIEERGAWVPLVALQESDRGLWSLLTVAVQDGEPVVRREAAEVLHVDGAHAYVRGTFEPGASVIANGTNRVVPGQRVALAGS
jgi:RND family efflux transporter MFP subunit